MKKLILLLLLIPLPIFASLHTWTSSEFEVFEFESTTVGDWQGNTMSVIGTGGTYDYAGITAKWDSHSYHPNLSNKTDAIGNASFLFQQMKNASAWTVEFWGWFPTKDTAAPGFSLGMFLDNILHLHILTSNWNPWGANMNFYFNGGNHFVGTFSSTAYTNGTANAWNRVTITWGGSYVKLYFNGTLSFTSAAGQANPFNTSGDLYVGGYPDYGGYWNIGTDRLIFHNGDTGGAEITPVPPTTPTFTITPTMTQTITQTITQTVTQTVTQTITPTVTETITPTVTETITPTVTKTITETITPTFTVTPTITATPTITPTIQPHSTNTVIIGYRIKYPSGEFLVVYKATDYKRFMAWTVTYAQIRRYPITDFDIIPLY